MARCCQHRKKERSEDRKRSFRCLMLQILLSLTAFWIPLVVSALKCIQLGLHSSRSSLHAVFNRAKIQKSSVYKYRLLVHQHDLQCFRLQLATTIVLETAVRSALCTAAPAAAGTVCIYIYASRKTQCECVEVTRPIPGHLRHPEQE
jgi:hypothetical protein